MDHIVCMVKFPPRLLRSIWNTHYLKYITVTLSLSQNSFLGRRLIPTTATNSQMTEFLYTCIKYSRTFRNPTTQLPW